MNSTHRILYKVDAQSGKVAYWEAWLEGTTILVNVANHLSEPPTSLNLKFKDEAKRSAIEVASHKIESLTKSRMREGYSMQLGEAYTEAEMSRPAPNAMRASAVGHFNLDKIDWSTAFIQPALPGFKVIAHYGVLHIQGNAELVAPHITNALKAAGLDKYVIEGVLYVHGYTLHEINQLVWTGGDAFRRLDFYMNDLMMTVPFTQRVIELTSKYLEADCPPTLRLTSTTHTPSLDALLKEQEALAMSGYRECVLYQGNNGYKAGKVSKNKILLSGSWKSSLLKSG